MNKYRLRREEILRGKRNFNLIFQKGSFWRGKYVNILYIKAESFKIGFAVSKKIKSAVKRNRLKRRLREIYRTNREEFLQNKNIILIAKTERPNYWDLKKEILKSIQEIKRKN